jgi:hypothetical protein
MGKEAHELSVKLSEHFKEQYDLELSWGYQWGGPTGVIYWWLDFDSMGHWEEMSMSQVADEALQDLMAQGNEIFPDGAQDTIVRVE